MIAMGAPDHCRRQRSKDLLQKSQVFHVLMRTKGRRTSVYSSMRMQPADQISDFSSQPSSKMTSGPRYCRVLMIFSRRSCSRTVLPKVDGLDARTTWSQLLGATPFLLAQHFVALHLTELLPWKPLRPCRLHAGRHDGCSLA